MLIDGMVEDKMTECISGRYDAFQAFEWSNNRSNVFCGFILWF